MRDVSENEPQIIDEETQLSLIEKDFAKFTQALKGGFKPNEELKRAMEKARNLKLVWVSTFFKRFCEKNYVWTIKIDSKNSKEWGKHSGITNFFYLLSVWI